MHANAEEQGGENGSVSFLHFHSMLLLALEEQPVTDGCNLVAVVKGSHVFHTLARLRKDAAGFPLDEVDVAATGNQLLCKLFLLLTGELGTPGGGLLFSYCPECFVLGTGLCQDRLK